MGQEPDSSGDGDEAARVAQSEALIDKSIDIFTKLDKQKYKGLFIPPPRTPMFTQQHYVAMADLIHQRRVELKKDPANDMTEETPARLDELAVMTLAMSKMFKQDNPKFKEFTFIESCNRDLKE